MGRTHATDEDSATTTTTALQYGISSMQGWRIHMEDAHIAQPYLFAEALVSAFVWIACSFLEPSFAAFGDLKFQVTL